MDGEVIVWGVLALVALWLSSRGMGGRSLKH